MDCGEWVIKGNDDRGRGRLYMGKDVYWPNNYLCLSIKIQTPHNTGFIFILVLLLIYLCLTFDYE